MRAKPIQREKVEQANGLNLLRSVGASVYVLGTRRRRDDYQGTMQTPGIPDVWFFLPSVSRCGWWEVKAEGGRLSPAQRAFRDSCLLANIDHIHGGVDALIAYLVSVGRLKAENVAHYRQKPPQESPQP